jgi:hypothetical protein
MIKETKKQFLKMYYIFCIAFSLAASMFEVGSADNDNLSDTDAELYILGVKYKTPNGK